MRGVGEMSSLVHTLEITTPQKPANPHGTEAGGDSFFGKNPANPRQPTVSNGPKTAQTRVNRHFPGKGDPETWPITDAEIAEREVFRKHGMLKEWRKLRRCGEDTVPFKCETCGLRPWLKILCGVRVCEKCYWVKFGKIFVARRKEIYPRFMRQKGRNGTDRLMFLTLTTVNTGRFPGQAKVERLLDRAVEFCRDRYKGWDLALEVKETDTGPFFHIHAVVYGDYIPHEKLCEDWGRLNGQEHLNTWIEEVKDTKQAISYLSRYLRKAVPLDDAELKAQYLKGVKGLRRVRTGGDFYGLEREIKFERKWNFTVCPRCGYYLELDYPRFMNGQTVREGRIRGDPSYAEAWKEWHGEAKDCADRALTSGSWPRESLDRLYEFARILRRVGIEMKRVEKEARRLGLQDDFEEVYTFRGDPVHKEDIPWDVEFEAESVKVLGRANQEIKKGLVNHALQEIGGLKARIASLKGY